MAFKMKGPTFFNKKSPLKKNVPTRDESRQKALKKFRKTYNEKDDAQDRGDVLTKNIANTSIKKQHSDAKKRGLVNKVK